MNQVNENIKGYCIGRKDNPDNKNLFFADRRIVDFFKQMFPGFENTFYINEYDLGHANEIKAISDAYSMMLAKLGS